MEGDCAVECDIRPILPSGKHPIETGRYIIPTKQIDLLCDKVDSWIQNRSPGGIVFGRPRIGKTWAIAYLLNELSTGENSMPVFSIQCRRYKVASASSFFEDLLRGVGHDVIYGNKVSLKRDRLNNYLIEKGQLSNTNRIILILDDAQRLHSSHYDWLMDVYNELNYNGIFMTVILVGQNELINQRSAFVAERKAQIVGRFMVHTLQFEGIKTINELKACFNGYDNHSEYPEKSGWSFTRYFFPNEFADGFRLSSQADTAYSIYRELQQENGIKKFEIPMQYLTLAVEYILKKMGANGLNRIPTPQDWKDAISSSGYITAEAFQDISLIN